MDEKLDQMAWIVEGMRSGHVDEAEQAMLTQLTQVLKNFKAHRVALGKVSRILPQRRTEAVKAANARQDLGDVSRIDLKSVRAASCPIIRELMISKYAPGKGKARLQASPTSPANATREESHVTPRHSNAERHTGDARPDRFEPRNDTAGRINLRKAPPPRTSILQSTSEIGAAAPSKVDVSGPARLTGSRNFSTLEATQGQIVSQNPTDATSGRWHLRESAFE